MSVDRERTGVFYGWWIVAVSLLVLLVHAGCAFYSFSALKPVLVANFGSSEAAIAGAASLYMLVLGLTGPVVGRMTDRYGPRRLILGGAVIAGAGLMLLAVANAVWQLWVLYGVIGIGMAGAGVVPVSATIARWFDRRRGIAMGVTMAGIALGAILIAPLTGSLAAGIGWQMTFLVLGAMTWVLVIPPVMLVMRTSPQAMGLLPDGAAAPDEVAAAAMEAAPGAEEVFEAGPAWSIGQAMKGASFWMMVGAFFLVGMVIAGVLQNEVSFLSALPIPGIAAVAAVALGFTGGIGGIGKLAFGFIADRLSPKYTAILCFSLQLVGLVILMFTQSTAMVWAFVVVFGFSMGGNITLQPLVTGELFGQKNFGAIFGWVVLAAAVGSALGPVILAAIYDVSGSYTMGFTIFAAIYAAAIVALFFARHRGIESQAA